ncbi:ornithine cyclodeaminase family protein [Ensifer adhaerens]|uniref:ornithine cyclodeaminase family protein n=1 Tax=Ensifer adhaerens TaxID=106592 RepID=UPI001C4E10D5|nr:ornithine cyclodeaminase family protein [Ensifer adhaerens]MBW0369041.1 ornithine cyclodeaminase family protein [Ensifer adhaerens]UCM22193.1 ornithine cyclodeaminase family protein [Ensifer adhaerens]
MIVIDRERLAELPLLTLAAPAIRDAYIAVTDGRANLPPVGYLPLPGRNADCHIKYGYIEGDPIFVVKIASGFYDNPAKGLPSSTGMMVAVSTETGDVVAVLDDKGLLTDLRTGLGGAIATMALWRKDACSIGIVGAGTQARIQIRALASLSDRPLRFTVWGRSMEKANAVLTDLTDLDFSMEAATDLETLCRQSDAIVTTTPSKEPLIRSEWIGPGTHITAMGADAPGKQELETALVARADRLFVDLAEQCLDHGELSAAARAVVIQEERCVALGAVLSGAAEGRRSDNDITIADLTGIATQDIAIARTVLYELGLLGRSQGTTA